MIKKLDQNSILNLCVNQVIIDLATCIKELVENSLDAGSTKIEIYLKEYGKEGVEVVDNGIGISLDNLQNIAQKGATSKLRQFQDLESLDTFGFRGEALNAISVLSKLTITTRTKKEEMAQRFSFNQDNTLNTKTLVAREIGTTIALTDLFGNIPVRKQELNKNIVSQYNKLVNLMTEYALMSINCQICLINQTSKKGREMILNSGPPMKNILQKVTSLFSKKISDQLVELKFDFGEECRVVEGYVLNRQTSGSVQESKAILKNMTYLYANTRPINPLKKINSIFSDLYKKYNSSARYIYILHMEIKKDAIDFNVSPDKRDVFIKYENEFYTSLRDNLTSLFERLNSIQKVLMPSQLSNKKNDAHMYEEEESTAGGDNQESSRFQQGMNKMNTEQKQIKLPFQKLRKEINDDESTYGGRGVNNLSKQNKNEDSFQDSLPSSKSKSLNGKGRQSMIDELSNSARKSQILDEYNDDDDDVEDNDQQNASNQNKKQEINLQNENKEYFSRRNQTFKSDYFNLAEERKRAYEEQQNAESSCMQQNSSSKQNSSYNLKVWGAPEKVEEQDQSKGNVAQQSDDNNNNFSFLNDKLKMYKALKEQQNQSDSKNSDSKYKVKEYRINSLTPSKDDSSSNKISHQSINIESKGSKQADSFDQCCTQSHKYDNEDCDSHHHSERDGKETKLIQKSGGAKVYEYKIQQSLDQDEKRENIQASYNITKENEKMGDFTMSEQEEDTKSFRIKQNVEEDLEELAEDLEDQLKNWENEDFKKEKFTELQIIGQFNKAFIVAYWVDNNEIYLIDQHASDEKTNYEKLLKENIFQGQRLVKPIELSLTIQEADILENNRDVFKKNGFQFQIQYDQNSEEAKLLINQLPSSKHIQFDINDFDEIFQNVNCEETDSETFRPKKIQRVLASKACRQSIMIGTALTKQQMKQILINLSKLQSPWNCPHGRPTMVKTPPMNHLTQQVQIKKVYDL